MLLCRLLANLPTPRRSVVHWWPLSIIGRSCHKYIFVATKLLSRQHDKTRFFVATKVCLSRQKYVGRDKHNFVATNHVFHLDKSVLYVVFVTTNTFVATKMILVAAPANDNCWPRLVLGDGTGINHHWHPGELARRPIGQQTRIYSPYFDMTADTLAQLAVIPYIRARKGRPVLSAYNFVCFVIVYCSDQKFPHGKFGSCSLSQEGQLQRSLLATSVLV